MAKDNWWAEYTHIHIQSYYEMTLGVSPDTVPLEISSLMEECALQVQPITLLWMS